MSDERPCNLGARALHNRLELFTILAGTNRVDGRTDQLDVEALQHAHLRERNRRVEGRLSAQGGQQSVGAFLLDDRGDHLGRDGLNVGRVRNAGVRHDGGRVGVDEDDAQSLFLQHAARLGARIVELAGLADHDGTGPNDENGGKIVPAGHQRFSLAAIMSDIKRSNSSSPSWGPAAASGWYWTEKAGMSRARRPSTTPSLSPTCETVIRP